MRERERSSRENEIDKRVRCLPNRLLIDQIDINPFSFRYFLSFFSSGKQDIIDITRFYFHVLRLFFNAQCSKPISHRQMSFINRIDTDLTARSIIVELVITSSITRSILRSQ
jgi:hypothetical protein